MDAHATVSLLENHGLHYFALHGDDDGVRRALREGADVNLLDQNKCTAIMYAVAGPSWQDVDASHRFSPGRLSALKILVSHPAVNLLTLNAIAPKMRGVTPLGMASWMNQPQVVRTMLEDSAELISVDGIDVNGATALMYATRDGSLEVVQTLLSYGARPDFRDKNHRSAVHFALKYPHILWLCQLVVRYHRWRESQSQKKSRLSAYTRYLVNLVYPSLPISNYLDPPPFSIFTPEAISRFNEALISCIHSKDILSMNSLLFPPAVPPLSEPTLYPMSVPPLVNLPDANGWSPIHHCMAVPQPSIVVLDTLYCAGVDIALFTLHEEQTPLHILTRSAVSTFGDADDADSFHGFCRHLIHDLHAPLSARDKDDETCLHIAAEHGHSIDFLVFLLDCDVSGNIRKMKNSRGLTPLEVSKDEFVSAFSSDENERRSGSALSSSTVRPMHSFASSTLHSIKPGPPEVNIDDTIQRLLSDLQATSLLDRRPIQASDVQNIQAGLESINQRCDSIVSYLRGHIDDATHKLVDLRELTSELDAWQGNTAITARKLAATHRVSRINATKRAQKWKDSCLPVIHEDREIEIASASHAPLVSQDAQSGLFKKVQMKLPDLDHNSKAQGTSTPSKASVFKAWLQRIIAMPRRQPLVPIKPTCESHFHKSNIGLGNIERSRVQLTDPLYISHSIRHALRASEIVLCAAHRDLLIIYQCIQRGQDSLILAKISTVRLQRAVEKRKAMIQNLLLVAVRTFNASEAQQELSPHLLGYDIAISQRPSLASIATTCSIASLVSSVASTVAEDDDENIHIIKDLLPHKIKAQISDAWKEVNIAVSGLKIIKEAVRGIKRRSYM